MTKSQIWIASLLLLFLILFGISQLTQQESESNSINSMPGSGESGEQTALSLIKTNGCTTCHGVDLKGTEMAPNITGVKQYWTSRDDLINYLRNPSSFMDKERFTRYREKYTRVVMPSFNNLDVKDLGKIADYLRSL
jgi:cytochrome c553